MAKDVSNMVRGLSVATTLIRGLNEELGKRGGYEEMLHFLTTERGKANLEKVAELIALLPWQVPLSLVKRLAREHSRNTNPEWDVYWHIDEHFHWNEVVERLQIPMTKFSSEPESKHIPMCQDFRGQLKGQIPRRGLFVEWEGERYVVVEIFHQNNNEPELDKPMTGDEDEFDYLVIAPVSYFILDL